MDMVSDLEIELQWLSLKLMIRKLHKKLALNMCPSVTE